MKNIKKVLTLSLLLPLVFMLTACGLFAQPQPVSAYDIWLSQGNTGSETDFLNSLRGETGQAGRDADLLYSLLEDAYKAEQVDANSDYYNAPDSDFWKFVVEKLKGEQGEPGDTNVWTASNIASRSAVSVKAFFTNANPSRGAGVIYKKGPDEAYIITNYHVISNYDSTARQLRVSTDIRIFQYGILFFDDGGYNDFLSVRAEFLGGVPSYDLAILRVRRSGGAYNPDFFDGSACGVTIPSRYDVTLGQDVIAVGNPLGEGISVTDGIVSVVSESLVMNDLENPNKSVDYRVIRTTAAINQGNSGGGLFDRQGRLVGIVNARTFTHGELPVDNMGYAIPLDIVVRVAEHIISRNGVYEHPLIGIQIANTAWTFHVADQDDVDKYGRILGEIYTKETVMVDSFAMSTHETTNPEDTTRLMKDDVFVSMTYERSYGVRNPIYQITRIHQIKEFLIDCYAADTVTFVVLRNDVEMTITLDMTRQHPTT